MPTTNSQYAAGRGCTLVPVPFNVWYENGLLGMLGSERGSDLDDYKSNCESSTNYVSNHNIRERALYRCTIHVMPERASH